MTRQAQILRIVVASPDDVVAERNVLSKVADELNHGIAADRGLRLEVSLWETDTYPGFHPEGPQGLIDHILQIQECDLLIGIFWKRFGTPVKDAKSGTEHEYRLAYEAWKRKGRPQIMLYFNQKSYTPKSKVETDQWGQVLDFKEKVPPEGFWWAYKSVREFERLTRNHLTQFLRREYPSGKESGKDQEGTATGEIEELAERLGVFETIKQKVSAERWAEYEELERALKRFAVGFREVDEMLTSFLSLSFAKNRDKSLQSARKLLIRAEGGGLMTRAHEVESHCNELRFLYDCRLGSLFERMLSPSELNDVLAAFELLETFHEKSLPELQGIMDWVSETASKALQKVDAGDLKGADQIIKQARIDVLPQRQAISKAVKALLSLESVYLAATRKAHRS